MRARFDDQVSNGNVSLRRSASRRLFSSTCVRARACPSLSFLFSSPFLRAHDLPSSGGERERPVHTTTPVGKNGFSFGPPWLAGWIASRPRVRVHGTLEREIRERRYTARRCIAGPARVVVYSSNDLEPHTAAAMIDSRIVLWRNALSHPRDAWLHHAWRKRELCGALLYIYNIYTSRELDRSMRHTSSYNCWTKSSYCCSC